jgi:hypothetical protein
MGGQYEGSDWVCATGYFVGTFARDWLSIPATGQETHIRFGEFCHVVDGKIARTYIILDLLDDLPNIREAAIWSLSQIGGEDAGPALKGLLEDELSDEETELIQGALERLDFLEEGLDMPLFDLPYSEDDEYILDDYDYQQDGYDDDGYDDDDIGLEDFDFDDDYWME